MFYKYLQSKARKNMPKILKLINKKDVSPYDISRTLGISIPSLVRIAKLQGISEYEFMKRKESEKKKKKIKSRNKEIISLIKKGKHTLAEIGKKYSLTNQRVQQIAKENGIMLHDKNHKVKDKIVQKMMSDTSKLTYQQIKDKYKIAAGKHKWGVLIKKFKNRYGVALIEKMRETRNDMIVDKYSSGKTAKKVIASNNRELKSPVQFKEAQNVYRISSDRGFRKFPLIKSRASGQMFENITILRKIVNMHEKKGMSFSEISKALNKQKLKTVTGTSFEIVNTNRKYLDFKRRGYKKTNPKHL